MTRKQTKDKETSLDKKHQEIEQRCLICVQTIPSPERQKIFGYGKCDHPVCYVCSARLRVLCDQFDCPVCREKLEHVILCSNIKPFSNYNLKSYAYDEKNKIYFSNQQIKIVFQQLLRYICLECNKIPNIQEKDKNFNDILSLKHHIHRAHQLSLCELCLTHNKLFPFEYSYYERKDLVKHMTQGEKNTSHRGHPPCKLCNQIFFNNDELLNHMSREHYHCHFCGRSSSNLRIYFPDYPSLRSHFKAQHFLCEKGNCRDEQFTSAFENDIDYLMHLVQVHGNPSSSLSRGEVRHQRTIEIESSPLRTRFDPRATNDRNTYPPNAVITTIPMAVSNSSIRNRINLSQAQVIGNPTPTVRVPSSIEFPALSSSSQPNQNNARCQNIPTNPSRPSTSRQNTTSFVRTVGGGRVGRIEEMDFPPLPDQPKLKTLEKKQENKKGIHRNTNNNRPLQSIDQLFSASLALGSTQSNKKRDNQKQVKQKPRKFQIS